MIMRKQRVRELWTFNDVSVSKLRIKLLLVNTKRLCPLSLVKSFLLKQSSTSLSVTGKWNSKTFCLLVCPYEGKHWFDLRLLSIVLHCNFSHLFSQSFWVLGSWLPFRILFISSCNRIFARWNKVQWFAVPLLHLQSRCFETEKCWP